MSETRRKKDPAEYWWFRGASVHALAARLQDAGPDARLEVRIDAEDKMTFRIVVDGATASVAEEDINESWLCPPICP